MSKLSILVVDDNPLARKNLESHLAGHQVDFAEDSATARRKLAENGHDLCFIDINLGEKDPESGLTLIPVAVSKGIYSVVMSGNHSDPIVKKAYSLRCDDFYAKGKEQSNVGTVLKRFLAKRRKVEDDELFEKRFITRDPATRAQVSEALKYVASDLPILILGPSGSGKTSLARVIHDYSGRAGEFVAINCSAYTEDLLEAELFGYRKGAFTGAADNRKGKLLLADQGTLFLDEIGSMSLKMQTKLLKAVEERSFYPLGSDKAETSDFRVVSATLEDLQRLLRLGKLRFDFFQRIHGVTIKLNPLAERRDDILPLLSFFTQGERMISLSDDAKERLKRCEWPGNVRQLRKLADLLVAGSDGLVTGETLKKLFETVLGEDGGGGFFTEEQYRAALSEGLAPTVERIIDGMIRRGLAENGGVKAKVMADLKIANRLLYTSLKRSGGRKAGEPAS